MTIVMLDIGLFYIKIGFNKAMIKFRTLSSRYYFNHLKKFGQYSSAGGWARWYSKVAPLKGKRVAKVLLNYKKPGSKLLDLGCGTGLTLAFLAQAFPNSTGCDIGAREVVATKTVLKDHGIKIPVIKYNGRKLPFPNNLFDIITFIEVIEHVDYPDLVLKEIQRVLKPDGILHITTANKWWPIEPHFKLPFLSYLPGRVADWYVSVFKRGSSYHNIKLPGYSRFFRMVDKNFEVKDITLDVIADYRKFGLAEERGQAIVLLGWILKILDKFYLIKKILVRFSLGWLFIGRPRKEIRIKPEERTIGLYHYLGWKRIFAKIRFWDAPFAKVEKMVPKNGLIVDLGCGEGIFSNYLAASSNKRRVLGIELNKKRVGQADRGLKNVAFRQGDVLATHLPSCDTIILFHLLHHLLSRADQEKLIKKCKLALKNGGKLIVVEVDVKPTFKYLVSWLTDHFVVPLLFEGKLFESKTYFRKKEEWIKVLRENGFTCKMVSAEEGKPFTHVIFNCVKEA